MTPAPALKPCPFCGDAEPMIHPATRMDPAFVGCANCDMAGPRAFSTEEGVRLWNLRPVSRQRAWQLRRQSEGLCTECGGERGERATKHHCRKCADKANALYRARYAKRVKLSIARRTPTKETR